MRSAKGLVSDIVIETYGPDGARLSSKTDARFVETGEPAAPDDYQRPEIVRTFSQLPFSGLL